MFYRVSEFSVQLDPGTPPRIPNKYAKKGSSWPRGSDSREWTHDNTRELTVDEKATIVAFMNANGITKNDYEKLFLSREYGGHKTRAHYSSTGEFHVRMVQHHPDFLSLAIVKKTHHHGKETWLAYTVKFD